VPAAAGLDVDAVVSVAEDQVLTDLVISAGIELYPLIVVVGEAATAHLAAFRELEFQSLVTLDDVEEAQANVGGVRHLEDVMPAFHRGTEISRTGTAIGAARGGRALDREVVPAGDHDRPPAHALDREGRAVVGRVDRFLEVREGARRRVDRDGARRTDPITADAARRDGG